MLAVACAFIVSCYLEFASTMPELPEVEVTRMGIAPHLDGRVIAAVVMRRSGLRWPFPPDLASTLVGRTVRSTGRRGKYLLIGFDHGTLLIHLGMSGHLRILPLATPPEKHDHFDLVTTDQLMRLTDPRRFGAVLWHAQQDGPLEHHVLLRGLGIEPLGATLLAQTLFHQTRGRRAAIKQVLLAGDVVVGVGNIYASESLFRARINPKTPAGRIALQRYIRLASEIQDTLSAAIAQGGSTLRDFVGANGQSGYFQQSYFVYDRVGEQCRLCGTAVRQIKQGQRSTFYCVYCQK
ncbi:MAG: formamidopyrimidine-DNA glycosylase [Burkholderiaceae bacterium]|jgi:formamidopyrimidine-DNA glycosylase